MKAVRRLMTNWLWLQHADLQPFDKNLQELCHSEYDTHRKCSKGWAVEPILSLSPSACWEVTAATPSVNLARDDLLRTHTLAHSLWCSTGCAAGVVSFLVGLLTACDEFGQHQLRSAMAGDAP